MYSKGISWIDDCRIPFVDEADSDKACKNNLEQGVYDTPWISGYFKRKGSDTKGRFPANIMVCDDMLNDGTTTKGSGHKIPKRTNNSKNVLDLKTYHRECAYEDKGSNSRYYDIDKWFDNLIK